MDYLDTVYEQFRAAGLLVDTIETGRLMRCKVEGDRGTKASGWYVVHDVTLDNGTQVAVGRYGNWKLHGDEGVALRFDLPPLSDEEKRRFAQQQQAIRERADAERAERAAEAASRAHRIWGKLPVEGHSPYLERKKVAAFGVRFSRGSVVVPVRNIEGALVGLQFIAADGGKKFLTGTPKRGAFHVCMAAAITPEGVLWIAEGYATAATVAMATGQPCVVAFDAGNLLPVARALRGKWPAMDLRIAADNDCETEGNPGVTRAREAALSVNARVVIPEFNNAAETA